MLKIGIVTHYHNSTNYGGSLQAYALCKALEQMGFQARQLRIDHSQDCQDLLDSSPLAPLKRLVGKPIKKCIKGAITFLKPQQRQAQRAKRQRQAALLRAFAPFNQGKTPHSEQVYTQKTIAYAVKEYDAFITGSDQVWNPIWYFPPFFLTFAAGVPKLSYAASIAQTALPEKVKALYRKHLQDFTAVSVREENAVQLLADISGCPVQCVLDPTLLLERQDWEQVCAPVQVDKPYAFCYFLGDDSSIRKTAADYAKANSMTLVNIPHAAGLIHKSDEAFGDVAVEDPSPEVFLSLIRHARYVFTDSFHASVFSLIFERQFVTFSRMGRRDMGSRLHSLTRLFDVPERFCDTPETAALSHIQQLSAIDYSRPSKKFQEARQHSLDFLKNNLQGTERK